MFFFTPLSRAGWSVTADTTFSGTFVASNAIDGNNSTSWASTATALPHSLIFDFASPQTFNSLSQRTWTNANSNQWNAFDVYVSSDGVTWGSAIASFTGTQDQGVDHRYDLASPVTFRYAKIVINTTFVNSLASVAEVNFGTWADDGDWAPHNMSANSTPSPYVASASTSFSFAGIGFPYQAFDALGGNSYWLGTNSGVDWLAIDIASSYVLTSYKIQVNTVPEPNRAPKDWTMEGSNDGSSWNVIDTVTGETSWASGEKRTYTCDVTTTGYTHFRVNITANNTDATYTQIAELFLYGSPPVPATTQRRSRSSLGTRAGSRQAA